MSGIVGSRHNIRGSGLVGSLGSDGQVFTSSGAGASAVFEAAAGGANTPIFSAYMSGAQAIGDNTSTKVAFDTEFFDTAGDYDHGTEYRFTPQTAGKYFIWSWITVYSPAGVANLNSASHNIHFNGSLLIANYTDFRTNPIYAYSDFVARIIDFDGSSDYVEVFAQSDVLSGVATLTTSAAWGGNILIE